MKMKMSMCGDGDADGIDLLWPLMMETKIMVTYSVESEVSL